MSHSERRHEAAYLEIMVDEEGLKQMQEQAKRKPLTTGEIMDRWRADMERGV